MLTAASRIDNDRNAIYIFILIQKIVIQIPNNINENNSNENGQVLCGVSV